MYKLRLKDLLVYKEVVNAQTG